MDTVAGELHHVSLGVTDLERSRKFYSEILSLPEIPRPPFDHPGVWFQIGASQHLHLNVHPLSTFRNKPLDTRDVHFAIRVPDYHKAVAFLHVKGYREDVDRDDPMCLVARPHPTAGFPQIYICDPDKHVIEINAAKLE